MKKIKLVRSRTDNILGGIFGGIAPLLRIDATILRLVFALIIVFTGIIPGLAIYLLCGLIIPLEDEKKENIELDINDKPNE